MKRIIAFAGATFHLVSEEESDTIKKLVNNYKEALDSNSKPFCLIKIVQTSKEKPIQIVIKGQTTGAIVLGKNTKNINHNIFDFFLLVLIQILCEQYQIYILHGSSVSKGKNGYIFLGAQGAGKSTIISFVKERKILADDVVILKKEKDHYCVYPSSFDHIKAPVMGEEKKILKRIFFLKKANTTYLKKTPLPKAKQKLLLSSFLYMYLKRLARGGGYNLAKLQETQRLDWIDGILKRNIIWELNFQKNNSFLSLLT